MKVFARVLFVILFALLATTAYAVTLSNLLGNASMETWSARTVASGWTSFTYRTVGGTPGASFFKSTANYRDGAYAQGITLPNSPYDTNASAETKAGVYQRIAATPDKVYILTSWALMSTSISGRCFSFELGIDPTGGTDPASANVLWGDPAWNDFGRVRGIWNQTTFSAKAQGSFITVFLRTTTRDSVSRSGTNRVAFDKVGVFAVDDTVQASLASPGFESGFDTLSGFENPTDYVRQRDSAAPICWAPFGSCQGYTDAYDAGWNKIGQTGSYMSDGLLDSDLNGVADSSQIRSGSHSLRLMANKGTCNWGVYQRVQATAGLPYTFTGYSIGPGGVTHSIGIDPTGGTNPASASVVWSYIGGTGAWSPMKVVATAQAAQMTVFLRAVGPNQTGGNDSCFDDMGLVQASQAPSAPAVTIPASGTVQTSTQYLNITWSGESHEAYELHISTSPTDPNSGLTWDSGQITSIASTHSSAGPLPTQGVFYIFARLKNGAGWGPWSAGSQYIMSIGPPLAPTITAPANGAVEDEKSTVDITWTGDPHDSYQAVVCSSNDPGSTRLWDSGTAASSASSCTSGSLPAQGTFYIFVRLHNPSGWGNWSASARYTTNVQPPQAVITSPASGEVNSTAPFALVKWNSTGSTSGYDQFDVRVTRINNPNSATAWESDAQTEFPAGDSKRASYLCGPMARHADLFIFVRLHNAAGWGPWSTAVPFRTDAQPRIIPQPQQMTAMGGTSFAVTEQTQIIIPPAPTQSDRQTALQLQKKVFQFTRAMLPVVEYADGVTYAGNIVLGQIDAGNSSANPAVTAALSAWTQAAGKTPKSEGSLLAIGNNGVVLAGYDEAGTFYAAQSLIQLLDDYEGRAIPGMFIYDWPDLKSRGVLIRDWGFYGSYDKDFAEELASEVLARYKMNVVQLEIRQGMIYDKYPKLNYPPSAITKAQTKDMVDTIKRYHIEVIPGGISTTHADQWVTDRYPELAVPGSNSSLDMNNPQTRQFLQDVLADQIEACSPKAVHLGGDEGSLGVDPVIQCVNFLDGFLNPQGIRPVIWGDMIEKDSSVANRLPADTIIQDWDYNNAKTDYPSLATWRSLGLTSWVCPYGVYDDAKNGNGWYNTYYSAISARNYGSEGLVAFNKAILGTKNETILSANTTAWNWYALDNYAQYPYYGEWAWTAGSPSNIPTPYVGREMFLKQFGPDRPVFPSAQANGQHVDLSCTAPINPSTTGMVACYRYDRYATDIADGSILFDIPLYPNTSVASTHILPMGAAKAYYSFFAYDALHHFSAPSFAMAESGQSAISLPDASFIPDQTPLVISGIVTAAFPGIFYIEDPNRTCGAGVVSDYPVKVGDSVLAEGAFSKTERGERQLLAARVWVSGSNQPVPKALGMQVASVGGHSLGYKPGLTKEAGPNNVGMLIRCWGKVDSLLPDGFVLTDASAKIEVTSAASVHEGQTVAVTGISLPCDGSTEPILTVRTRTAADVTKITE